MISYATTDRTKKDCFAFKERSCAILLDRVCDHKKCNFYKTKERLEMEIELSRKRREGK